jgi:hypothetical protein
MVIAQLANELDDESRDPEASPAVVQAYGIASRCLMSLEAEGDLRQ